MKPIRPSRSAAVGFFAALLLAAGSWSQENQSGDFDIVKVQEAVRSGVGDTLASGRTGTSQAVEETGNLYLVGFRIVGYLALIILLIVGGVWVMRRSGLVGSSRIGGGSMDLLEVLPIGQNRMLALVRVMDDVLVLANTPQHITVVEKIEGEKAVELIASTKGGTSIVQFRDLFSSFVGKAGKAPEA